MPLSAGYRLGCGSSVSASVFVVETELDGLLGVPPRRRYLPILAGMLADLLLYCGLVLYAAADLSGGPTWAGQLALAVTYTVLLRLAWQLNVFLRTDLYYSAQLGVMCSSAG